jgi:hypothetical protein
LIRENKTFFVMEKGRYGSMPNLPAPRSELSNRASAQHGE